MTATQVRVRLKAMTSRRIAPIALLFLAVACGPNTKRKAVETTLVSVNAARDGFVAWDGKHQKTIVDTATSFEQGKEALSAYRTDRSKLEVAFAIAYKALATAALDLKTENISIAMEAARQVYEHVRQLMGDASAGLVPKAPEPLVPPTKK